MLKSLKRIKSIVQYSVDRNSCYLNCKRTSLAENRIRGNRKMYCVLLREYSNILYLTLYVRCVLFQCVDKPTRCNTSYD